MALALGPVIVALIVLVSFWVWFWGLQTAFFIGGQTAADYLMNDWLKGGCLLSLSATLVVLGLKRWPRQGESAVLAHKWFFSAAFFIVLACWILVSLSFLFQAMARVGCFAI
jgi:hypothetical protein